MINMILQDFFFIFISITWKVKENFYYISMCVYIDINSTSVNIILIFLCSYKYYKVKNIRLSIEWFSIKMSTRYIHNQKEPTDWPLPKYLVFILWAVQYRFNGIFNFPESHAVPYGVSHGPKSLQMLAIHHCIRALRDPVISISHWCARPLCCPSWKPPTPLQIAIAGAN